MSIIYNISADIASKFARRQIGESHLARLLCALLLLSPSVMLSVVLATWIIKDAAAIGLSERARLYWIIAAVCFGLPAYITYRLTRPKMTLVACANCGKPRRPDMDICHRCGSKWHVPELAAPLWRVTD